MKILLTGGAGYIGSHTALTLLEAGHEVVLLDNFCNSRPDILERLAQVVQRDIPFVEGDIRDVELVESTLRDYAVEAVIHFAGLKAVGESVAKPLEYYSNNVYGSLCLLKAMQSAGVRTLVFSSSATVYGDPKYLPIDEQHPTGATNPYGRSKLHVEEILRDLANADSEWRIACLRYFNPVGAHPSGLIGEDPQGVPNNLMPYIARVAMGQLPYLQVYGTDYPTVDGTGVRDYIHVMDLAEGHLAALHYLPGKPGWHAWNLGTGRGCSVLEMIRNFEAASGVKVEYRSVGRRPGDVAECYAKADLACETLQWKATRTIAEMCASVWRWQRAMEVRKDESK